LSLTVTVMFLMSSPSGGTKRFPGLPSIYDCPRMEGNYLQNLRCGRRSLFARRRIADSQLRKSGPGPPNFIGQMWATRLGTPA
jgi:hypothetical protein